jgi:hypothetical protein
MRFLLEQDPGVQHYGGEMFQVLRRPEMGNLPGGKKFPGNPRRLGNP